MYRGLFRQASVTVKNLGMIDIGPFQPHRRSVRDGQQLRDARFALVTFDPGILIEQYRRADGRSTSAADLPQAMAADDMRHPPYDRLTAARGFQRLRGVDVKEGAASLDRNIGNGFGMFHDQVARADVAVEGHQFGEETPRP